jgi:hypothetical protein
MMMLVNMTTPNILIKMFLVCFAILFYGAVVADTSISFGPPTFVTPTSFTADNPARSGMTKIFSGTFNPGEVDWGNTKAPGYKWYMDPGPGNINNRGAAGVSQFSVSAGVLTITMSGSKHWSFYGVTMSGNALQWPSHGLSAGDKVICANGTFGTVWSPLTNNITQVYVISAGLTTDSFQVSATSGGSALTLSGIPNPSNSVACWSPSHANTNYQDGLVTAIPQSGWPYQTGFTYGGDHASAYYVEYSLAFDGQNSSNVINTDYLWPAAWQESSLKLLNETSPYTCVYPPGGYWFGGTQTTTPCFARWIENDTMEWNGTWSTHGQHSWDATVIDWVGVDGGGAVGYLNINHIVDIGVTPLPGVFHRYGQLYITASSKNGYIGQIVDYFDGVLMAGSGVTWDGTQLPSDSATLAAIGNWQTSDGPGPMYARADIDKWSLIVNAGYMQPLQVKYANVWRLP